jgi:SAM-dependent methyltransferase
VKAGMRADCCEAARAKLETSGTTGVNPWRFHSPLKEYGSLGDMPNIDLKKFSDNLMCRDGIWFSESDGSFSYPKEGHEVLFQIEEKSYWFIHRNDCIIEAVKRYPPRGVFFELGGGNGYVSKFIQDHGYDVVLMEPSTTGIENARRRGVDNVICSTFENAHLNRNSIPAIGIFDVLEHIPDDAHFLMNVKEMIARNGRLYITAPAYSFLWSREDIFAGHFRRYTLPRVSALLQHAGFAIEYATYFFSPLVLPIFLLRTIPHAFGVRGRITAKRAKRELVLEGGRIRSALGVLLNRELAKIRNGRSIACGSSCLIVARAA